MGRVKEDISAGRIQLAPLLQTQNFGRKFITEFLLVSGCVFYYFYIIQKSNS